MRYIDKNIVINAAKSDREKVIMIDGSISETVDILFSKGPNDRINCTAGITKIGKIINAQTKLNLNLCFD